VPGFNEFQSHAIGPAKPRLGRVLAPATVQTGRIRVVLLVHHAAVLPPEPIAFEPTIRDGIGQLRAAREIVEFSEALDEHSLQWRPGIGRIPIGGVMVTNEELTKNRNKRRGIKGENKMRVVCGLHQVYQKEISETQKTLTLPYRKIT